MDGVDRSGGTRGHVELAQNIAEVPIDRSLAQAQLVGNLVISTTVRRPFPRLIAHAGMRIAGRFGTAAV
jgi:hypothetical protein